MTIYLNTATKISKDKPYIPGVSGLSCLGLFPGSYNLPKMNNTHFLSYNNLKMSFRNLFIIPFILLLLGQLNAQNLQEPIPYITQDNSSFIFLRNGKTIEGKIIETKNTEGFLLGLTVELSDGSVSAFEASDMRCMYISTNSSFINNAAEIGHYWDTEYKEYFIDQNFIDNGFTFFESIEVDIQDEEVMVLMQLLNPKTDGSIRVYEDPLINSTLVLEHIDSGLRDNTMSYYLKSGNTDLQLIEMGDYHFLFHQLWGDCINVVKKYPTILWKDMARHIEDYTHFAQ